MEENRRGAEDDIYLAPTEKETADITAEQNESSEPVSPADTEVKKIHKNAPTRVSEIRNQRTEHSKTFKMSDGTEQVVFHAAPIHAPGEKENEFEDVDLSLVMDEEGKHFKNAKGGFKAKFSCDDSDDELFSIEKNGCSVIVFAKKNKNISKHGVSPKFTKLAEGREKLSFKKALAGADLEYSLKNDGVKEDILVKTKKKTYVYPFVLKCTGVTAMLDEETNRVAFVDSENKEVFHIPAPFMKDASGVESTALKYQMEQVSADEAHLSVIADSAWINDEARAMPVVIDPQIKISGGNIRFYSWKDETISTANTESSTIGVKKVINETISEIIDCSPVSRYNAINLEFNRWRKGHINAENEEIWYRLTTPSDGRIYKIFTQGYLDTVGTLYNSNYEAIASNDDSLGLNFSITHELECNQTYYLMVKAFGSKCGDFQVAYAYENATAYIQSPEIIVETEAVYETSRLYINFKMPTLPDNPRIKKAELVFHQNAGRVKNKDRELVLFHTMGDINNGIENLEINGNLIDYNYMVDGDDVSYAFDISTFVDSLNKTGTTDYNLLLKMYDETPNAENYVSLVGTNGGENAPEIRITYESNYAVNTSYRTHTHALGKFGEAAIDLKYGNLTFDSTDFSWAGNRMPVTIKHLYNSILGKQQYTENSAIALNIADFSKMNVGNGFRLNLMQSMCEVNGEYVYTDENGAETVFTSFGDGKYKNVDGDMEYDSASRVITVGDEKRTFDSSGRLIKIEKGKNVNSIIYENEKISTVIDGAGREFLFAYSGKNLASITAPDNRVISYSYTNDLLTEITYPDNSKAMLAYTSNNMPESVVIRDPSGHNVYKVVYEFSGYTVSLVNEYGFENGVIVEGNKTAYDYSIVSGRTTVTTFERDEYCDCEHEITTVYTFDDEGNPISNYVYTENFGNTGIDGEVSGIHPYSADGGATIIPNNTNLLYNHTFAKKATYSSYSSPCIDYWQIANECCSCITMHADSFDDKFRKYALLIDANDDTVSDNVVYQTTAKLPAGDYTFSAYVKVKYNFDGINPGAYLRVYTNDGIVLAVSEKLVKANSEYIRLIAPFKLFSPQAVRVEFVLDGMGAIYVCAPQLENNPFANEYNMLQNGNFELGDRYWNKVYKNCKIDSTDRFNMSNSACIEGATYGSRYCSQIIYPITDRSTRETFTLSGWAKGYGLPMHDRHSSYYETTFRLRARIKYYDPSYAENGYEDFTVDFSPCTDDWQFVSLQFSKSKYRTIHYIEIFCDYDYNFGTAFFDDIQLVRNSIETGLTANDFVVEEADEEVYTEENNTDTKATDLTEPVKFTEVTDDFGNTITETTFTDGEFGTIYRSFGFTADGNDLVTETDARGNKTTYEVEAETSRNNEVTDRCGNKTAYEYDNAGRTTKVTSKNADGAEIAHVSYAYDAFDNMTEIARGDGMSYDLTYNAFHNLESIGIDGKTEKLIQYTYKNGNGRLKEIAYANGDRMATTYNSVGQLVAEKWYNSTKTLIAHYKYVYDNSGNIVRSIDILGGKEYNYIYNEGMLIEAITYHVEIIGERIIRKNILNTIRYIYDSEGNLTKKNIVPAVGESFTYNYETNNDVAVVKFTAANDDVTSHSKTDSFGRKSFDELQFGTGFISRQFEYVRGVITDEHINEGKLKSSPTTQLVSRILFSDGRTIEYEYDAEERITKVIDSIDGTTEYTYDALGQLLTETVNGSVINSMTYDTYGNIRSKNGKTYTYNQVWKDLLASIDGDIISYDEQGNPTSYFGHTLTWEKGRQLKSFDNNTYTYNANGIRTSKTVNGVKHEYMLDGTKIIRETWGENVLVPIYDSEDSICGIIYNGTPHYFLKNLQGDIISITNSNGEVEARYTYDAWGAIKGISGTDEGISIAVVNPFRYRSYYYDVEIGLYYLQSRYYDAINGKFINADVPEYCLLALNATGHNLLVYCINNPVNLIDSNGNIALVDDAAVWTFMGLYAVLMLLLAWMSTPQFQRAWIDFCTAVANGLSWIATGIINGGKVAWNWTRKQVKAATAAITTFLIIARADSKIKSKVRKKSKDRYWTATLRTNYVDIGRAISYSKAVKEVSNDRNVFTVTSSEAKAVAKAAYSNKKPVGPEIDKGKENTMGYYYHYHVYQRKKKGHVFFLFW